MHTEKGSIYRPRIQLLGFHSAAPSPRKDLPTSSPNKNLVQPQTSNPPKPQTHLHPPQNEKRRGEPQALGGVPQAVEAPECAEPAEPTSRALGCRFGPRGQHGITGPWGEGALVKRLSLLKRAVFGAKAAPKWKTWFSFTVCGSPG